MFKLKHCSSSAQQTVVSWTISQTIFFEFYEVKYIFFGLINKNSLYDLFLFVFRLYQHLTFARFGTSFFRFPFVKHLTLATLGLFPFSQAKSHPPSWQLNFTFPDNFKLFFLRISPQLVIDEFVGKKSTPIFAVSDEAVTPQETF